MTHLFDKLAGGERRSIGLAAEVAREVLEDSSLLETLIQGIFLHDPILRLRSAHALMRVAAEQPDLVQPYKELVMERMAPIDQWEVREQVCKILPGLVLSKEDIPKVVGIFQEYLEDRSSIVKTCAMQGLADLTEKAPELEEEVRLLIESLTLSGTPAMRARGRKLLKRLRPYG